MSFFADKNQQKGGLTRIFNTLIFSRDGLIAAWEEAAFRQLVFLHISLIFLALIFVSKDNGKLLLITVSFLSLVVELFNTSIEAVVDRISLERHPLSKLAKDCGSAAQLLLMLILCSLVGISLVLSLFEISVFLDLSFVCQTNTLSVFFPLKISLNS